MNPDRLKQIEEIYQAAIELTPNERALFLERTCGDDEDLRREVESLLSFDNTFDSLVDNPAESLAAELFSEQETPQILGLVIGHFEILHRPFREFRDAEIHMLTGRLPFEDEITLRLHSSERASTVCPRTCLPARPQSEFAMSSVEDSR